MTAQKTSKEFFELEQEFNQLKISIYKKRVKFMIIGFIGFSIVELLRCMYYWDIKPITFPVIALFVNWFLLKIFWNVKSNQELVFTIFSVFLYLISVSAHYYCDTGYFNVPVDTFYFAYAVALMERFVAERIPSARNRTMFTVSAALTRLLVFPLNDKGIGIISTMALFSTIYFDFEKEKQDNRLFGSYFYSKEQLGKFKDLVEHSIPEQIIIVSNDLQRYLFVNTAFKSLIEADRALDIRSQLDEFRLKTVNASNLSVSDLTLLNLLENRSSQRKNNKDPYHFSYIKSSEEKIFETKILDIVWEEHPAIAIVLHDITQQQTILQLRIAADTNKDKVIATVSHELRTPLNGILGMIQLMFKKIQDQELLQYLKICKNSANLLLGLVNSILDLNQIRANKLRLNYEKVDLRELLNDIYCLFEYQCAQKKISLKLNISSKVPQYIKTDRNRLGQIFINLVGNALKFTSKGSILISAEETNDKDLLKFCVRDTGMGIKNEDKNKLFQMYGKLDQENTHVNRQGVGLGLTISNNLAQLLCNNDSEGGIRVESEYGGGSLFSFMISKESSNISSLEISRLDELSLTQRSSQIFDGCHKWRDIDEKVKSYQTKPIKKYAKPELIASPRTFSGSTSSDSPKLNFSDPLLMKSSTAPPYQFSNRQQVTPTILIVDDNPFNITVATFLVQSQGFHVKSALYGSTAIELAIENNHKAEPIILILMDCQMPVMDGYETTTNLKQLMKEGKVPEIPIVALTANNSAADREACVKAGMCDYLTKPLTEANLIKVLKKFSRTNYES